MIEISEKSNCCGCSACINICPKKCIKMDKDKYGFLYPKVDSVECIKCGLCEKVCPEINRSKTPQNEPYLSCIVRNKDEHILKISTSGGFFYGICQYVIKKNGVVYGVSLDENLQAIHTKATTIEGCKAFLGSKYVQSNVGNTFSEVKNYLEKGIMVCFSGTPCQVQGLYNYLKKSLQEKIIQDNLILVDIACHGVVSPYIWNCYLEYEKNKYKKPVSDVQFRSKKYGYQNSGMRIHVGTKDIYSSTRTNPYLKCFFSHIALRESCYQCPVKSVSRYSDFTIYDGWNAHAILGTKDDDKGYTNVIVQSQKGKDILKELESYLEINQVKLEEMLPQKGGMIMNSASKHPNRDSFLEDVYSKGFDAAIKHYFRIRKIDTVIERAKFILCRLRVFRKLSRIKRGIVRKY